MPPQFRALVMRLSSPRSQRPTCVRGRSGGGRAAVGSLSCMATLPVVVHGSDASQHLKPTQAGISPDYMPSTTEPPPGARGQPGAATPASTLASTGRTGRTARQLCWPAHGQQQGRPLGAAHRRHRPHRAAPAAKRRSGLACCSSPPAKPGRLSGSARGPAPAQWRGLLRSSARLQDGSVGGELARPGAARPPVRAPTRLPHLDGSRARASGPAPAGRTLGDTGRIAERCTRQPLGVPNICLAARRDERARAWRA